MVRLILIRHGDSHHSRRGVIGGPIGCTGLTERGAQQACALGARLRATGELGEGVPLLSSSWPRARETADLLASSLTGTAVEAHPGLRELDPGESDGLSWADYRARYGAFDLQASPDRPFSPGGESWSACTARVETTLEEIAERFAGSTVVAVTHAGFIVNAFLGLFGVAGPESRRRAWIDPVHTALTEWHVTGTIWHLVRYNDASHLADQSETGSPLV